MPRSSLPKGVHRVRRKTVEGTKFHFYAWRGGGPKFWESTVKEPREPEFLIAFAEKVQTRHSLEYMTPQMVDDFLDSTAMPNGERTQADLNRSGFSGG